MVKADINTGTFDDMHNQPASGVLAWFDQHTGSADAPHQHQKHHNSNLFSHPTRTCIAAELEQTWTDKRETSCAAYSENADESGRDAFR